MTVSKFVNRPVEVEALCWTGENEQEVLEWTIGNSLTFVVDKRPKARIRASLYDSKAYVWATVNEGDWIVRNVEENHYYTMSNSDFQKTFMESLKV